METLRFALLLDGGPLQSWQLRCVEELEDVAELAWTVIAPGPPALRAGSALLERYLRRVAEEPAGDTGDRLVALSQPPTDRDDHAVDFVLGLGNVEVTPGLAGAARLGVWRFEHELDPSRAPFLDEVCHGRDVTYAALLRFDGQADTAPTTIESGVFRTDTRSYGRSRRAILDAIACWPARACVRAAHGALARSASEPVEPATGRPGLVRLLVGVGARRLVLAWERLFRHPQWNVGVLHRPVETLLAPGSYTAEDVEWFPLRNRRAFLADPFAVERDGRLHVLCEYFDYDSSLGRISAVECVDGAFEAAPPTHAWSPGTHVSYPFLLDLPEGLHCVPETAAAREVALYRVREAPEGWEKVAVLLEEMPGVDSTLFHRDGVWWLMCACQGPQEDAELLVWHASELRGPWAPHSLNPVKTDVRGARPAGVPFDVDGVLYRPAQDCSSTYGGRITLHRVDDLTPTTYAETQVAVLEGSPRSPYPIGPHTLSPVGDQVMVDGRRTVFVPAAFVAFLGIWARAALRRMRRSG